MNMDAHLIGIDLAELVMKQKTPSGKRAQSQVQVVKADAGPATSAKGAGQKVVKR